MKTIMAVFMLFALSVPGIAAGEIMFGIASVVSAEESYSLYTELSDHVAREANIRITSIQRQNYAQMNALIEQGSVDFATVCTGALLYLPDGSYDMMAVPMVRGSATYHSYIISNAALGVGSVAELKGRVFAFTDRLSNSGALYPTYLITKNFEPPETFFSKIYQTGSHDKSIYLVNHGVVDGAAVDSLIFDYIKESSPNSVANVDIIHVSPSFIAPPIVASSAMDENLFAEVQRILLTMHKTPEGKRILDGLKIDRFIHPDDAGTISNVSDMKRYLDANAR